MVNEAFRAERALALSYAPAETRTALRALFALDEALAGVLRTTREPMVGQMRLTWWHEALSALDSGPAPANPVLRGLAGVTARAPGAMLAGMVEGWEALLDEPLDSAAMERFAAARGGGLFRAAAAVLGRDDPRLEDAGEGWALADLARHLGDANKAALARALAAPRLAGALRRRWPRRLRALGALVLLAKEGAPGSPGRVARLLWHRISGT